MRTTAGTIVAAVDGSESSRRAVAWAAQRAAAEGRALTLAHAVDTVQTGTPSYVDAALIYPQEARRQLMSHGLELLSTAHHEVEQVAPGLDVHEVADFADPRSLLMELSTNASMVVLGSRGRGPIRSLLLGSVGVALIRHADCPVVVHRPQEQDAAREGVLVGTDLEEHSRSVLEFAFREASLRGVALTALHCYWGVQSSSAGGVVYQSQESLQAESRALDEAVATLTAKYPDVTAVAQMTSGPAYEVLGRLGARMDLVVVGGHHVGRLARAAFGSTSARVVERASCPVAVVPVVPAA